MSKSGKLVGVCNGIWHCGLTDCLTEHDLACEHSQPTQQKCQCSYLPIPHEHSTTQQENNMSKTKKCHCMCHDFQTEPYFSDRCAVECQHCQQKDAGSWEKDFDKWFGHREGKKLRFAYATGVFEEVKAFIREVETQARQQPIDKIVKWMRFENEIVVLHKDEWEAFIEGLRKGDL
jgi:hypothetical protein